MDISVENDNLLVKIKSKGAELVSIRSKETGVEYMWSGDPTFWAKTSPILFPIVGTLKEDTYLYKSKAYNLPRHGFARDMEFQVTESANDYAVFALTSSPTSMGKYPFEFRLKIRYSLKGNSLHVNYAVGNEGTGEMYFSIGGHPAFKVPLIDGTRYEDYYLMFNKVEEAPRWPISDKGLIETNPAVFINNTNKIQLNRKIFEQDAIVLKHLHSDCVSIRSFKHDHGLDFYFEGFPFFGIWAAKNADFVCLEPWCGIADAVNHNQELTRKEGIEKIGAGESWSREWKVVLY